MINVNFLPFKNDKGMHGPGQVEKSLVSSNRINSPLGNYLRFERWKELRKSMEKKDSSVEMKW